MISKFNITPGQAKGFITISLKYFMAYLTKHNNYDKCKEFIKVRKNVRVNEEYKYQRIFDNDYIVYKTPLTMFTCEPRDRARHEAILTSMAAKTPYVICIPAHVYGTLYNPKQQYGVENSKLVQNIYENNPYDKSKILFCVETDVYPKFEY